MRLSFVEFEGAGDIGKGESVEGLEGLSLEHGKKL